ncbi:MAG: hypothetical protein E5V86_11375 [Mesorhizobium sp.]|nr:MAG: hypothetical protein E5V86_11375 [Mesorhizobium sp.]
MPIAVLCRKPGLSEASLHWRRPVWRHGSVHARRLKSLEDENRRLKKLLAESMLDARR